MYEIMRVIREPSHDEFTRIISDILETLILPQNNIDEKDRIVHTERILELYHINFGFVSEPPELLDIVHDVQEWNWIKLLDVGEIDYGYGNDGRSIYHDFVMEKDFESKEDYIAELAELWELDYVVCDIHELEDYVESILLENALSYRNSASKWLSFSPRYDLYHKADVFFNDCQNKLFKQWPALEVAAMPDDEIMLRQLAVMQITEKEKKGNLCSS